MASRGEKIISKTFNIVTLVIESFLFFAQSKYLFSLLYDQYLVSRINFDPLKRPSHQSRYLKSNFLSIE